MISELKIIILIIKRSETIIQYKIYDKKKNGIKNFYDGKKDGILVIT